MVKDTINNSLNKTKSIFIGQTDGQSQCLANVSQSRSDKLTVE